MPIHQPSGVFQTLARCLLNVVLPVVLPVLLPVTLAAAAAPVVAATTVLYDATLGSVPAVQGWTTLSLGGAAAQSVAGGLYQLDTTAATVGIFGNSLISPLALNTASGFELTFNLQIVSESHTSANRAGYSVVMIGADPRHSLEIDFWADHVWAQDYDPAQPDRLVHGVDAAFDTTAAVTTYTLAASANSFTLSSAGLPLLAGALRDYSAAGFVYGTPNVLFFGDNSTRGVASSKLGWVTLTPVPEPTPTALLLLGLLLGWASWGWRRRTTHQQTTHPARWTCHLV